MTSVYTMVLLMVMVILVLSMMMMLLLLLLVCLLLIFVSPDPLHVPLVTSTSPIHHTVLHLIWVIHPEWIRRTLRHGRPRGRGSLVVGGTAVVYRGCVAIKVSMLVLLLIVKLLLLSRPSTVMPVRTICHLLGQMVAAFGVSSISSFASDRIVSGPLLEVSMVNERFLLHLMSSARPTWTPLVASCLGADSHRRWGGGVERW